MKLYKFLLLNSRLIISAFVLATITLLFTGNWVTSSQDKEIIEETPTPVELGVMTEKQRAHSKLYDLYERRKQLTELLEEQDGEIDTAAGDISPMGAGGIDEASSKIYPNMYLRGIANDADAIVIGVVKEKASQITDDGTFVFTDHEVAVEEFLKLEPSIPSSDYITVTRPGGTIQLRGRIIRAKDLGLKPFKIDSRYLFFLKYVPATDSYRAFRNGSFLLQDNQAIQLTKHRLWPAIREGVELSLFLKEARDAIALAHNDKMSGIKNCCDFRLF